MSKPKLSPEQVRYAQQLAHIRAQVISEVLALDGVPMDATSAAALLILSVWSWHKAGHDNASIVRMLRGYADNMEAGKRIK